MTAPRTVSGTQGANGAADRGGEPARPLAGRAVAVIGLGVMGTGVTARLLEFGADVRVWNRTAERAGAAVDSGATLADTPAAAARDAELVLLSVATMTAARNVLFGPVGVLGDGSFGGVLACTSTVAPADVEALRGRAPAVLDIGVMGNGEHARTGELRLYVGGEQETLARVRPLLDPLAKQVLHVGELGSGMRLKLLMNLLMGAQLQAMAEAIALGTRTGLDRALVIDAITQSGFASPVMKFKARRMAVGRYDDPDFRLRLMAKDLALAVAEARRVGLALPLTRAVRSAHADGVDQGLGDADCAVIVQLVGQPEDGGSE